MHPFALKKLTLKISKINYMLFGNLMLRKLFNVHVQSKLLKSASIMYRCSHLLDRNSMCILYSPLFVVFKLLCKNLGKHVSDKY